MDKARIGNFIGSRQVHPSWLGAANSCPGDSCTLYTIGTKNNLSSCNLTIDFLDGLQYNVYVNEREVTNNENLYGKRTLRNSWQCN